MKASGDQQLVKRINRSLLLRLLRASPGRSRARLAQESGLTKSTVSALVRELLDERWLVEADAPVAGTGLGRPSTPLEIDAQTRVLIGLEIGVRDFRLVTVSLTGQVLDSAAEPLLDATPDAACAQAASLIRQAWAAAGRAGHLLSGIGICLPGAIDPVSQRVRFAPNLGWRDIDALTPIRRMLAQGGLPDVSTYLHNDADAAALGELEFGDAGRADPLIFVSCDVGVGAGIVLHDRLFTGAGGMAGEVGHSVIDGQGLPCSCGRRGCAETLIGARALAQPDGVNRGARALGLLIQNLDALFNPNTVVIGGSSPVVHPTLLGLATAAVEAYARAGGVAAPSIRAARFGLQAAAVGAAALAWHQYLRPTHAHADLAAGARTMPSEASLQPPAAESPGESGALTTAQESSS